MKGISKSLLALPIFTAVLLWGVSIVATPVKSTSLDGLDVHSLVAAYNASSSTTSSQASAPASTDNLRGTVVRFLEGSELIIDDGNGRVLVDYQERWKPLNLRVGDRVTIRGQLQGSGESREVLAEEIIAPRGRVYPQQERYNQVYDKNARNHISLNDTSTSPMQDSLLISDILFNSKTGDMVTIDGEVFELPEESVLILRDSSGTIVIDIDDAQSQLNLQKGDRLSVTGKVTPGTDGKKELQAMSIEKKSGSSY